MLLGADCLDQDSIQRLVSDELGSFLAYVPLPWTLKSDGPRLLRLSESRALELWRLLGASCSRYCYCLWGD